MIVETSQVAQCLLLICFAAPSPRRGSDTRTQAAMTWRLLLLSLLCLNFSAESKELETCLRSSNNRECRREKDWPKLLSKLCREESEPSNTIFHCDSEETPLDDHPGTYEEGENITLTIRGEVLGQGCSFEMTIWAVEDCAWCLLCPV